MGTTQPIRKQEDLEKFKEYYRIIKPNQRNYLMIEMGFNSALRISDILSLKCNDVFDFELGKIREHLIITEKKTGKVNQVFLNEQIRETLMECVDFKEKCGHAWLFESRRQKEKPLSRHQAFRIIKAAAEYAGFPGGVSCHSLRKTFGYHAWKQGTPPAMLMNIYNHSSYQITMRYLGIDQDDKDEVYKKVCL